MEEYMNIKKNVNLKTIYYRGSLCSCNYKCPYCPFHLHHSDLEADQSALNKFAEVISELRNDLTVMLVPNGEAMINEYYHRIIASLCGYEHVKMVGCQTNLSFNIRRFVKNIGDYASKISLWCTYHPSQVREDDFLKQCETLQEYGIAYCVGAVGHPTYIPLLRELRRKLPEEVYLWINAMEGFGRNYNVEEIAAFIKIDPLFRFELEKFTADPNLCKAGRESIFVDANGDYFSCNISKVRLGNLYTEKISEPKKICRAKKCSCYLAYSNKIAMRKVFLSTDAIPIRNPSTKRAIFFDVDGTLTDKSGKIPKENIWAVKKLAEHNLVFLATSLPNEYAKHSCEDIWEYLAGGVFAEGSDIQIFNSGFSKTVPLDEDVVKILPANGKYSCYRKDGILHKIAVISGFVPDSADYNIIREEITGIVSKSADKLSGILCICKELNLLYDHVTVVGNSENDVPMLTFFQKSVAVLEADNLAKDAAHIICGIDELVLRV